MKVFAGAQSREDYRASQVARSDAKFGFCGVSARDVRRYRSLILRDLARRSGATPPGPILCLGTRNGREIDVFRLHFFGRAPRRWASLALERHRHSRVSLMPALEAAGRSAVDRLAPDSVIGVEINPRATRSDVWVGSFDEMPPAWGDAFGIAYSNAFDHSQDPHRTAAEWRRVLRPGGYLIFCFSEGEEPNETDRVGDLYLSDVQALFPGHLLHYQYRGSVEGYCEAIVRLG